MAEVLDSDDALLDAREAGAVRRVAITQPYVPRYRVPLLRHVIEGLGREGIEAKVFFGGSRARMRAVRERGDEAQVPWASEVVTRSLVVPGTGQSLTRRILPPGWRGALLLTEMRATNGDAWWAAFRGRPFVTLGHGMTTTARENPLGARMETWLNRRAAQVLTYTEVGRTEVLRRTGRRPSEVTAFNNTNDTTALRQAVEVVGRKEIDDLRARTGLPSDARVALVLATLTPDKLPELTARAAAQVLGRDPRAWLLVAGSGPGSTAFDDVARSTGRVVRLGHVGAQEIAAAARVSSVILNPGRIGLLAVDALTVGLPVLTTTEARHAPEVAYLVEGRSMVTVPPTELADAWLRGLDGELVAAAGGVAEDLPTVEAAAGTIARAVTAAVREQR